MSITLGFRRMHHVTSHASHDVVSKLLMLINYEHGLTGPQCCLWYRVDHRALVRRFILTDVALRWCRSYLS